MKKTVLLFFLIATCSMAKAQLSTTKWSGALMVPDPLNVVLDFKEDVVDVVMAESGEVIESMSYTIAADTLTLKKISGASPCDESSVAKLKFAVAADKLNLTSISDGCPIRAESWTKDAFVKVKQ